MAKFHHYLNFNGRCKAAFDLYRSVFGGEFTQVMLYKDMPSDSPMPDEVGKQVMHMGLPLGEGLYLMGSDIPEMMAPKVTHGSQHYICISPDDEKQAKDWFDRLAEGGAVKTPLDHQFWGALFGEVTDKFGINWMINLENEQ